MGGARAWGARGRRGVRLRWVFTQWLALGFVFWRAAAGAAETVYGDITFYVASDLHYGYVSGTNVSADISLGVLDRMNTLAGEAYPTNIGGLVDRPRGVVLVGDLTESGSASQWAALTNVWGLKGERRLTAPLYEAFGNHDLRGSAVAPSLKARNPLRPGVTNLSANGYHYSWDWDFLHLVHLNLFPGNAATPGYSAPDPKGSLAFLAEDLARCVGTSGRPIMLFHHYGTETGDWSPEQKTAYFETIKNYNVLGIFSGHTHGVRLSSWKRFYTCTDGTAGKISGNFFVVHLTKTNLVMVERKATNSWGAQFKKTLPAFNPKLDTDKDGLPDWWEKHYGLSTTDARDALRDSDGDGKTARDEYVLGTDPTDKSDCLRIALRPAVSGSGVAEIEVAGYVGRSYTLERSIDPIAKKWMPVTDTPVLISNQRLVLRDPNPPSAGGSYRIQVTLP